MVKAFQGAATIRRALEAAGYSVLHDEKTLMAGSEDHVLVIRVLGGRGFHVQALGRYGTSEARPEGAQAAAAAALEAARKVTQNPSKPAGRRTPPGPPIRRPAKRSPARRRDRP